MELEADLYAVAGSFSTFSHNEKSQEDTEVMVGTTPACDRSKTTLASFTSWIQCAMNCRMLARCAEVRMPPRRVVHSVSVSPAAVISACRARLRSTASCGWRRSPAVSLPMT